MLRNSSCHVQVPGYFLSRLRYLCEVARPPLGGRTRWKSPCPLPVTIFSVRRVDVRFEQRVNIKVEHNVTVLPHSRTPLISLRAIFFCFHDWKKAKRTATWEYRGYSSGCDDGAHRHSERGIHHLLSGLAETLATVHWLRRELVRGGQEALVARLNFLFLTDSVSELYWQRKYIVHFQQECHNSKFVIFELLV
jgi:hypothetical protein